MRIGIIGGTGAEGSGLGVRWARAGHEVKIGSRDASRGQARAAELSAEYGVGLEGGDNEAAIAHGEVVVLSVPYAAHARTLEALKDALQGKLVIDITVPLKPPKVRTVQLPEGNAAALEAQALLGEGVTVAGAFHHVSAHHLLDVEHEIDCDVLVVCNDRDQRKVVIGLCGDLGLRGLDAGRLPNAVALESLTPVLIHMNKAYKVPGTGIRITGLPDAE